MCSVVPSVWNSANEIALKLLWVNIAQGFSLIGTMLSQCGRPGAQDLVVEVNGSHAPADRLLWFIRKDMVEKCLEKFAQIAE